MIDCAYVRLHLSLVTSKLDFVALEQLVHLCSLIRVFVIENDHEIWSFFL